MDRYSRQRRFAPVGDEGQQRLASSRVAIVGCGALGTHLAQHLVRGGVGFVRLCDRDVVEWNNLQRQVLFDESDVTSCVPKAPAAAAKLRAINHTVDVEPRVVEVDATNVRGLIADVDLVLDGTDNLATRFLLNEACVAEDKPWVYAGVIGSRGMVMPIRPGTSACFACLLPGLPEPESDETCETAGVIGPAVAVIAGLEAAEAFKILTGRHDALAPGLAIVDIWENDHRIVRPPRRSDCRVCAKREFLHLESDAHGGLVSRLCGGNAIRIVPAHPGPLDLDALERAIAASGPVRRNEYLLRFSRDDLELLVFEDGRALVRGTEDLDAAQAAYRRYVGDP